MGMFDNIVFDEFTLLEFDFKELDDAEKRTKESLKDFNNYKNKANHSIDDRHNRAKDSISKSIKTIYHTNDDTDKNNISDRLRKTKNDLEDLLK